METVSNTVELSAYDLKSGGLNLGRKKSLEMILYARTCYGAEGMCFALETMEFGIRLNLEQLQSYNCFVNSQ